MSAASEPRGRAAGDELTAEAEVAPAEDFARALLQMAMDRRASDLFLSDDADGVLIQAREMGGIRNIKRVARSYGSRLQNYFRTLTEADVGDLFSPAEGHQLVRLASGDEVEIRLSAMPTIHGQDVAIRLFPRSAEFMQLDRLGLFESEHHRLRRMLDTPGGFVLVAGPTGSGKTNTLYACIKYLVQSGRRVLTLEEPVEFLLPGVVQSQVNLRAGLDFPQLLQAALRHSPDVIMIGELRDKEAADIAIRAAGSGQLVLATVHAQNAVGALHSVLAYETHPHFLASSLVGVVAQRLVRRLCPSCREREDAPAHRRRFRSIIELMPEGETPAVYHPRGCDRCNGEGFDRLVCVPEILVADPPFRQALVERTSAARLEEIAVHNGMAPFEKTGRLRIATGETTADELRRVLPHNFD